MYCYNSYMDEWNGIRKCTYFILAHSCCYSHVQVLGQGGYIAPETSRIVLFILQRVFEQFACCAPMTSKQKCSDSTAVTGIRFELSESCTVLRETMSQPLVAAYVRITNNLPFLFEIA